MKKQEQDNNLTILVTRLIDLILKNLVIDIYLNCKIHLIMITKIQLHLIPIFMGVTSNLKIKAKMNIIISI